MANKDLAVTGNKGLAVKKVVSLVTNRIDFNINELSEAEAKKALSDLSQALLVLFIQEEPRLADPSLPPEKKVRPFFKAIMKLGIQGIEAWSLKGQYLIDFEAKISKFKDLEGTLTRLTK